MELLPLGGSAAAAAASVGVPMSARGEAEARRARPRAIAGGRHLGESSAVAGAEADS